MPDVFRSPFQVAPLDLDSDAFYPARREQLDKLLTRIADGEAGGLDTVTSSKPCCSASVCTAPDLEISCIVAKKIVFGTLETA